MTESWKKELWKHFRDIFICKGKCSQEENLELAKKVAILLEDMDAKTMFNFSNDYVGIIFKFPDGVSFFLSVQETFLYTLGVHVS